jgi:beta-1,4-mannosyltransferase
MIALETTPDVISVGARVPVEAVQIYFRAADVAVLAQRDALNSGGLLLALTFGIPVIAPRIASAVEIVDERVARLYDADDPDGLLTALRSAPDLATEEAAAAAREIAARYEPARISRAFVDELRRRISPVG